MIEFVDYPPKKVGDVVFVKNAATQFRIASDFAKHKENEEIAIERMSAYGKAVGMTVMSSVKGDETLFVDIAVPLASVVDEFGKTGIAFRGGLASVVENLEEHKRLVTSYEGAKA